MKNLIILIISAIATSPLYAALPYLRTATVAVTNRLQKAPLRSFTQTSPLKVIVSDTIWKTRTGEILRVMGDRHVPSDKPYFNVVESSLKDLDQATHKTTFVVEGIIINGPEQRLQEAKIPFSKINLVKLNTLAKSASFKLVELHTTHLRNKSQVGVLLAAYAFFSLIQRLPELDLIFSHLTQEDLTSLKENLCYFKVFNRHTLEKMATHLNAFAEKIYTSMIKENHPAFTKECIILLEQIHRLILLLSHLKEVDLTTANQLTAEYFNTLDVIQFIKIIKEIKKSFLALDAQKLKECERLLSIPDSSAISNSLMARLEDAEILMHLLQAIKSGHNFIAYAGLGHALNINKILKSMSLIPICHSGPLTTDRDESADKGLDIKTIEANNSLLLHLLHQRAQGAQQ